VNTHITTPVPAQRIDINGLGYARIVRSEWTVELARGRPGQPGRRSSSSGSGAPSTGEGVAPIRWAPIARVERLGEQVALDRQLLESPRRGPARPRRSASAGRTPVRSRPARETSTPASHRAARRSGRRSRSLRRRARAPRSSPRGWWPRRSSNPGVRLRGTRARGRCATWRAGRARSAPARPRRAQDGS
jgi:hypothetical protein